MVFEAFLDKRESWSQERNTVYCNGNKALKGKKERRKEKEEM